MHLNEQGNDQPQKDGYKTREANGMCDSHFAVRLVSVVSEYKQREATDVLMRTLPDQGKNTLCSVIAKRIHVQASRDVFKGQYNTCHIVKLFCMSQNHL